MNPRTRATLDQLQRADWFTRVGIHDTDKAVILASWAEAIERCGSLEWEDLCQEAVNQYTERLRERSRARLARWNDVVEAVRPAATKLAEEKTRPIVAAHKLPDVFTATVRWDILHLCMEAEYADIQPPGFYAAQGYWYLNGHFPCGWDGDFPNGRLMVF